jgi:hypothetical protein
LVRESGIGGPGLGGHLLADVSFALCVCVCVCVWVLGLCVRVCVCVCVCACARVTCVYGEMTRLRSMTPSSRRK